MPDRYKSFAEQNLPADVQADWLRQMAPPAPPPAAWQLAQTAPPPAIGPGLAKASPRPPPRTLEDTIAAANGGAPLPGPPAPQPSTNMEPFGPPPPPPEPGSPYKAPASPASIAGSPGMGTPASMAGAASVGGMQKTSETTVTHRGHPASEEERLSREDASVAGQLAAQAQYEHAVAQGQFEGEAAVKRAAAVDQYAALERKAAAVHHDRMDQETRKYEADIQAVREGAIDPDHYWKERGTGAQILGAIAMALGGFVQGYHRGGPNAAADIINRAIDRDIDAQAKALANKREAASMQRGLFGELQAKYGDDQRARLAYKAMALEKVELELKQQMAGITDKAAFAHYQDLQQQIADKKAGVAAEQQKRAEDDVTIQSQEVNQIGGKYGGRGAGGGGSGLTGKEETDANDLSKELVKSGIPEARSALDRLISVIPQSGEIPGIGGVHGVASMAGGKAEQLDNVAYNFFGSKQGQEIRQAAAVLFNKQLKDESGAAVSDQELERHKQAFYGARDAASARRALEAYGNRLNAIEATIRSGHNANVNRVQKERRAEHEQALGGNREVTPVTPIGAK